MFEKFMSKNYAEFAQRYQGTYGFYRGKDKERLLVKIDAIDGERCSFIGAKGEAYHINADAEDNVGFEFIPPKPQWYNTTKGACIVQRRAARQFLRGICDNNVNIFNLSEKGMFNPLSVNFASLEDIYLKAKTVQEGYAAWDKVASVAISGQMAVTKTTKDLYLWTKKIGSFDKKDNHFTVKLEEPNLWRTEVSDAFRSINCTVEVS